MRHLQFLAVALAALNLAACSSNGPCEKVAKAYYDFRTNSWGCGAGIVQPEFKLGDACDQVQDQCTAGDVTILETYATCLDAIAVCDPSPWTCSQDSDCTVKGDTCLPSAADATVKVCQVPEVEEVAFETCTADTDCTTAGDVCLPSAEDGVTTVCQDANGTERTTGSPWVCAADADCFIPGDVCLPSQATPGTKVCVSYAAVEHTGSDKFSQAGQDCLANVLPTGLSSSCAVNLALNCRDLDVLAEYYSMYTCSDLPTDIPLLHGDACYVVFNQCAGADIQALDDYVNCYMGALTLCDPTAEDAFTAPLDACLQTLKNKMSGGCTTALVP